MERLSENIVNYYIKKKIVSPSMKIMYVYGVSLILNDILTFSIILAIAALIHGFYDGVIFLVTFYILRIRSGGFHAKKTWICRASMISTFLLVFISSKLITAASIEWIVIPISILSLMAILPIVPVENPNKILDENKKKKNKVYAIITALLFLNGSNILTILNRNEGIIITLTVLSVAVLAVIGKVIYSKEREVN